jgi:hypothetical protein
MRKFLGILIIAAILVLVAPATAAQTVEQPGAGQTHAAANGSTIANATTLQIQNQAMNTDKPVGGAVQNGTGQPASVQKQQQLRNELQLRIEQKQREQDRELANMTAPEQAVQRNRNAVRLAVHTFLSLGEVDGGIGQNLSAIARNYNNSVQASVRAEERIESRSGFVRFFAGGDEEAAAELERLRLQNQERIREMNSLIGECECDQETKALLREQLMNMEGEQVRLQQIVVRENADMGLFGWIWK